MKVNWTKEAAKDIEYWKKNNKNIVNRIKEIIADIPSHPFEGIGKPEPLKYGLQGCWSRRITQKDHLVYRIKNKQLEILSCRYHYNKN